MSIGAIIEYGAVDWQIFQHENGFADITLGGSVYEIPGYPTGGYVTCAVFDENSGMQILPWTDLETADCKWHGTIHVPAGGPYRIEVSYMHPGATHQYPTRGDIVRHVGVGDVFLISGQSNGVGSCRDSADDPPEMGIHALDLDCRWDIAAHPLLDTTNTPYTFLINGRGGISPWLRFAKLLRRQLGYPIGLVQAARGNCAIAYWDDKTGENYPMLIAQAKLAGKLRGVLWFQGENDADYDDRTLVYAEKFKKFVADVRRDLQQPDLPFLTVQIGSADYIGVPESIARLREAQRQAARTIDNVYIIPSYDMRLYDHVHINAWSTLGLGERMARMVLEELYGIGYGKAPDLGKARCIDGNRVELEVLHLRKYLDIKDIPASLSPFTVIDDEGEIAITDYKASGSTVTLTLERAPGKNAVLHHVYGTAAPRTVLSDFQNALPVLSGSVPIE